MRCVSRVYTDHAIFDIDSSGERPVRVLETFGITVPAQAERRQIELG